MSPRHTCSECGHEQGNESYDSKIMARQSSIISSVLSATVRIDEARLRGVKASRIDELMKAIREEEGKR